ncbi:hypothetical protein PoB_004778200 [Plakobranchus ocellatus]|uniref:Uncharacterized protein n=1 Tax=Plakobranchus ocellatus TaxID=259542 RepID=A0AAV4BPI0_9GAST|nr:hypothetical protein PoB_004778200 [Plakobranchus ocellatus]
MRVAIIISIAIERRAPPQARVPMMASNSHPRQGPCRYFTVRLLTIVPRFPLNAWRKEGKYFREVSFFPILSSPALSKIDPSTSMIIVMSSSSSPFSSIHSAVATIGEVLEVQKQHWSCLKSKELVNFFFEIISVPRISSSELGVDTIGKEKRLPSTLLGLSRSGMDVSSGRKVLLRSSCKEDIQGEEEKEDKERDRGTTLGSGTY